MEYAVFLFQPYDDEADVVANDVSEYLEFGAAAVSAGVFRGGSQLQAADVATTVRLRAGDVVVSDGPFVESKEQLAGFYILECATLDDAIRWAARIPTARLGAVEIRPLRHCE